MITKNNKYDHGTAIAFFREPEFSKIPQASLIDIIPSIVENSHPEMAILDKWRAHFEGLNVPYAITRKVMGNSVPCLSLWKKRRI